MTSPIIHQFEYGQNTITLETGRIARQATGSVLLSMGEVKILATVVANQQKIGTDFFPLTVVYQEKSYAAGKIPGSFFKREARPSESEVLTSRLIDRPIRPLFPKNFMHEVQVICTVMSTDGTTILDVPAMIAASAALSVSGVPFAGPIAGARVGLIDDEIVLNPSHEELQNSRLDMVVSGTAGAVLMVESDADQLPESKMLESVFYAHEKMQTVIENINLFVDKVGVQEWPWQPVESDVEWKEDTYASLQEKIKQAYSIVDKQDRRAALDVVRSEATENLVDDVVTDKDVEKLLYDIEKTYVRKKIIDDGVRIDGRDTVSVRKITPEVSILPRVHGSSLFTRGETQALVTVTLGSLRDAQKVDALEGLKKDNFMLHYNFPPYCVGETGMMGSPKRREIGHGFLAKRALSSVLPTEEEFPYSLRVVSEITESNGSSSMASVCGGTLALMDAGVPIKTPVAGIAMGLIKEGDKSVILTDILGDEDHLGDMDFKVAGTENGVTALQMDIKITGINKEIMDIALNQARDARMHILSIMNHVIAQPKDTISPYAPVVTNIQINPKKIRDLIGKGGANIRQLTEETGVDIDIADDGKVEIYAANTAAAEKAIASIKTLCFEPEVGKVYPGVVKNIVDFGAFISIGSGVEGLLHISQIKNDRIERVEEHLSVEQNVQVKVLDIDSRDRIKLSMLDVAQL